MCEMSSKLESCYRSLEAHVAYNIHDRDCLLRKLNGSMKAWRSLFVYATNNVTKHSKITSWGVLQEGALNSTFEISN